MRKALIAVAVATALFAVGAFAAAFTTTNAEDVASGNDTVDACADEVDIDFDTVFDGVGDWDVDSATVTFYNAANAPTQACEGFGVNLAVGTAGNADASTGTATVATDATSVSVSFDSLKAGDITSAAVLVDGKELLVETPEEGFQP
ncbi:MAG: hypothetical protein ABWZ52_12675 [Acidimicrobiales bacterium]